MFAIQPYGARNLSRYFDELERSFFGDWPMRESTAGIKTDIRDCGDHFLLEAELPGFDRKDIHLALDGEMLTIRAEHSEDKEEKRDGYLRRERHFGTYQRSFDVSEIDAGRITAAYRDGVLALTLPKAEEKPAASRAIEIGE